jgi:hypothetical protein
MGASVGVRPRILYVGGKKGSIPPEVLEKFDVAKHITVDTDPSRITIPLRLDFVFLQTSYLSHKVEQKIRACIGATPMIRLNKGWNALKEQLVKYKINTSTLPEVVEKPVALPPALAPCSIKGAYASPGRKLHPRTREYTELYRRWNPTMHHRLRELQKTHPDTYAQFFTVKGGLSRLALDTLRDWVEKAYGVIVSDIAIRTAYKKPFVSSSSSAQMVDQSEITKLKDEIAKLKTDHLNAMSAIAEAHTGAMKKLQDENKQAWDELERVTKQLDAIRNIVCPPPSSPNA